MMKVKKKIYLKIWSKIKNQIIIYNSITYNSEDCNEKYFINTSKLHNVAIVVKAVFHESKKFYLQVFRDEYIYKLWIILYLW